MDVIVVQMLSCVQLFSIPWTVAHQAPLSMGSPRQEDCSEKKKKEYWSGLLFLTPGDFSQSRVRIQVSCIAGRFLTTEPLGNPDDGYSCLFIKTSFSSSLLRIWKVKILTKELLNITRDPSIRLLYMSLSFTRYISYQGTDGFSTKL